MKKKKVNRLALIISGVLICLLIFACGALGQNRLNCADF